MNKLPKLHPDIIYRITKVFSKKKWQIDDSTESKQSLFNRYCKMIENLSPVQQDLILMLTEDYKWISINEYLSLIKKAFATLNQSDFSSFSSIYVMPLISPDDIGKPKSSTFMAYLFKDVDFSYFNILYGRTINIIDKTESLPSAFNNDSSNVLLMVDDFIGTGETAIKAIDNLKSKQTIDNDKIFILSIAAQEEGVAAIQRKIGNNVYTFYRLKKGLSDKFTSPEKDQHIQTMQDIEFEIEVQSKYHLGYGQSEALITLIRTPDNTFPIFWHENHDCGRSIIAPFPR